MIVIKHRSCWRVLSWLLLAALLLVVVPPLPAQAGSQFITEIVANSQTTRTVDVSFHYGKNTSDENRQDLTVSLYAGNMSHISTYDFQLQHGTDSRGDYEHRFYGLEPNTQYFIRIHGSAFTAGAFGNTDRDYYSDYIAFTTRDRAEPEIDLDLISFKATEVTLQGILISTGTGNPVGEFGSNEHNNLDNVILFNQITICKKSDNIPTTKPLHPDNGDCAGKIAATTGNNLWYRTANIVDFPRTLTGLEPNTEYVAQATVMNFDGKMGQSPRIEFRTLQEPEITITDVVAKSSRAYVNATINLDSRDSLNGAGAVLNAWGGMLPQWDSSAIRGELWNYDAATGKALFYFSGLTPETDYEVQVSSLSQAGKYYSAVTDLVTSPPPTLATVATGSAPSVLANQARLNGQISDTGNTGIIEHGFIYSSTDSSPQIAEPGVTKTSVAITSQTAPISFSTIIRGLEAGETYYYVAYARNSEGYSLGEVKTFTTQDEPGVATGSATEITIDSAVLHGLDVSTGGIEPTLRGIVYSENSDPYLGGDGVLQALDSETSSVGGDFSVEVGNLAADTTYYYKAFIHSLKGTYYGDEESFTTLDEDDLLPLVTTISPPSLITDNMAVVRGAATAPTATTISEYGAVYSEWPNPVIGDNGVVQVASTDPDRPFDVTFNGLEANTTYYYRAYASNENGTAYGGNASFKTLNEIGRLEKAIVGATSVSEVTATSALVSINVANSGTVFFGRKVVYSSVTYPPLLGGEDVEDVPAGGLNGNTGVGVTETRLSGLSPNTTYYVCGYTNNTYGSDYGEVVSFTTGPVDLPLVSNLEPAVDAIEATTARVNAHVDGNGGVISNYGAVYSFTSDEPSLGDPDSEGIEIGDSFAESDIALTLSGLKADTEYYCKVYAENEVGIAYGETTSFTTGTAGPPVLATGAMMAGSTTVLAGGELTDRGDYSIAELGVVIGPDLNPQLSDSDSLAEAADKVEEDEPFSVMIDGLYADSEYYARAYAITTDEQVFYGNEVVFSTLLKAPPTVLSHYIYSVGSNTASLQAQLTHPGDAPVSQRGVLFGTVPGLELGGGNLIETIQVLPAETGVFSAQTSLLQPSSSYYARPYAVNGIGTAYGDSLSFTTIASGYRVIFDLNGGQHVDGTAALEQIVEPGGAATAPQTTRTGYRFAGWDRSFSAVYTDMTVTAQWQIASSGGGGGGGGSPAQPPVVVNSDPANLATAVSVDKVIQIEFNQSIQPGKSFSSIALRDSKGQTVDAIINPKADDSKVVIIAPQSKLKYLSAYTLTVPAAAVKNKSGVAQKEEYVLNFTTEPELKLTKQFVDMNNHWALAEVNRLVAMGILSGYEDGTFRPENHITRTELAVILSNALKLPPGAESDLTFADSADIPAWGREAVAAVVRAGLLKGYEQADGSMRFEPQQTLRRVELAVIMGRILELKLGTINPAPLNFADNGQIAEWAKADLAKAVAMGVISGYPDNSFRGENLVTRAETVSAMVRLLKAVEGR